MSDAKSFAKKLDPKVLKKLEHFDVILPKLVRVESLKEMQELHDKISIDVLNLGKKLFPLDSIFQEINSKLSAFPKDLQECRKRVKIGEEKDEKIEEKIKHASSDLSTRCDGIESTNTLIQDKLEKLSSAFKNLVGKAEFGTLYSQFTDLSNEFHSFYRDFKVLKKEKEEMKYELQKRREDLQEVVSTIESHWNRMDQLYQDLAAALTEQQKEIPKLRQDIDFLVQNTPKEIELRISEIKLPEPGMNEKKAKEYLDEKFYPVSLESKNTSLRCSNNEMKLNLLEKKLDQLSVSLKRFELEK